MANVRQKARIFSVSPLQRASRLLTFSQCPPALFGARIRRMNQILFLFFPPSFLTIVDCPPSLAVQVKFLFPIADAFIVPSVPDRLSVRGSLYLLERIAKFGYTTSKGIGTLWSLYREQNHVHRDVIDRTNKGAELFNRLPRPFETIIPNATAIADATDPDKRPPTFKAKYTPTFAKVYYRLCEEIVARTAWQDDLSKSNMHVDR